MNGIPTSFGHDAAGRLLSTQTEGRSTSYAYDGLDRRTSMTDETVFGSDTTGTTWDGLDPVATDSGLHGSTELLRDPTGEVVFQAGAFDDAWVLGDARNATATADAGGRITDLVDYADFGAAGFESTGWASLVGNDGQPGDATLGLDHYYARDYDTATGSWVQPDEWRGLLVRPQSLNRFAYVENSPVAFSDHLGYASKKGGLAAGFGKAVAIKSWSKAGVAAAVGVANGRGIGKTLGKSGPSTSPRTDVRNPWKISQYFLTSMHLLTATGCDHMDKDCRGGSGNLFGWSDDTWRTIGGIAIGVTIGIVATLALVGTAACGVLTLGACALVVGIIAGAVGGAAAYGMTTEPQYRTPAGYGGAAAAGGAAGFVGGVVGAIAGKVVSGIAGAVGKGGTSTVPKVAPGAANGLTSSQQKALISLQQRLDEHVDKLNAYRANPDLYDNKGFLAGASSPEIRQSIIDGRIRHLEQEIRNFRQQIDALRGNQMPQ